MLFYVIIKKGGEKCIKELKKEYEWLPSANLERNEKVPTVEVYPFGMSDDGFEWEIRIPIK